MVPLVLLMLLTFTVVFVGHLLIQIHPKLSLQSLDTHLLSHGILLVQEGGVLIQPRPIESVSALARLHHAGSCDGCDAATPVTPDAVGRDGRRGTLARVLFLGLVLEAPFQAAKIGLRDVSRHGEVVYLTLDRRGREGDLVAVSVPRAMTKATFELFCEGILEILTFLQVHQPLAPPVCKPGIGGEPTLGGRRVEAPRCRCHAASARKGGLSSTVQRPVGRWKAVGALTHAVPSEPES
mmetsp:Transcript_63119/g.137181  ORF Transcript_63119/g.137181 Transcript_63119/m.137181 type:complete len:238 (-) Transcript_63119:7-720(-)